MRHGCCRRDASERKNTAFERRNAPGGMKISIKKPGRKQAGPPLRRGAEARSGALLVAAERVLHGVLDAARGVLHLAGQLVALAFGLKLGVAERLAGRLLDAALRVFQRAFDAIFVSHGLISS